MGYRLAAAEDDPRKAGDDLVRRLLKTPPDHKKGSLKRKVPRKVNPERKPDSPDTNGGDRPNR